MIWFVFLPKSLSSRLNSTACFEIVELRLLRSSEFTKGSGLHESFSEAPLEELVRLCAADMTGQSAKLTDLLHENLRVS